MTSDDEAAGSVPDLAIPSDFDMEAAARLLNGLKVTR